MTGKSDGTLPQVEAAAANWTNGPRISHCYSFTPKTKASFTWTLEYICSIFYLPKYEVHIENSIYQSPMALSGKSACATARTLWAEQAACFTEHHSHLEELLTNQSFGCGCGAFPQKQTEREPLPSSAAVAGLPAIESELWQKTRRFENVSPPLSLRASQYLRVF